MKEISFYRLLVYSDKVVDGREIASLLELENF